MRNNNINDANMRKKLLVDGVGWNLKALGDVHQSRETLISMPIIELTDDYK